MIQFFRKIREKLLSERKFSTYLIYALGEIALVVVGILIALWINNWNESQKEARIERAFLENFRKDLETDIQTLNEKLISNTQRINHTDSIISTLSKKVQLSEKEWARFYQWNLSLAFESYFIPEKSTISQFKATNKIHLISSKELKDKLFRYYSTNDRIEANVEKSMQLYQHNFLTKDIIQNILGGDVTRIIIGSDLDRPNFDLNELKQNSEYVFALLTKKITTTNQNEVYRKIILSAEELIEGIDQELK
jgi:hypothetical protein